MTKTIRLFDSARQPLTKTIRVQANHLHGIANKLACQ